MRVISLSLSRVLLARVAAVARFLGRFFSKSEHGVAVGGGQGIVSRASAAPSSFLSSSKRKLRWRLNHGRPAKAGSKLVMTKLFFSDRTLEFHALFDRLTWVLLVEYMRSESSEKAIAFSLLCFRVRHVAVHDRDGVAAGGTADFLSMKAEN